MMIYLVQHGDAVEKDENPDRPLSGQGRRDVMSVAVFLGQRDLPLEYIWHSGKSRARETAEILAQQLRPANPPTEWPGLAPKDPVSPLRDLLGTYDDNIMLVGHLPHLERVAGFLLTGDEERTCVGFEQGSVLCVRRGERALWQVQWMLTPPLIVQATDEVNAV